MVLAVLGLVIFGAGLGLRGPWPADEPRFALIAVEMVETGEWLVPHRAGELYPDKPPLFFWAIAALWKATGSLPFAFLLPSLLASLGSMLLVYDLGRRLWHRRVGLAAALSLMTIVQFPLQARMAQIDASVTFWTTLGLYGLVRHLLLGPSWRWWWGGCFAMGLGIITKGVGFLPLLALIPWALARRRGWRGLPVFCGSWWRWSLGPVFLLLAVGVWLGPMLAHVASSGDPDLLSYRNEILWGQTAERYAAYKGHQRPIWYYFGQVIPSLWLPASFFLPWLIPAWLRRLRRRDARYLVLLGWVVLVVLFFTMSSGKRGVYVLPAVPAFALTLGPLVAAGVERIRGIRVVALALLVLLTTILGAAGAGMLAGASWAVDLLKEAPVTVAWPLAALGLLGVGLLVGGRQRPVVALAGFLAGFWVISATWAAPKLDPLRSGRALMSRIEEAVDPNRELGLVGWREQMILHAHRPVTHWGHTSQNERHEESTVQMQAAARWLDGDPAGRVVVVPGSWRAPCFAEDGGESLGRWHRLDLFVVTSEDRTAACHDRREDLPPGWTSPVWRATFEGDR